MVIKVVVIIYKISKIISYICIEVNINWIKYSYDIVCYIFIVVIVNVFNYCNSIRVMYVKVFVSMVSSK